MPASSRWPRPARSPPPPSSTLPASSASSGSRPATTIAPCNGRPTRCASAPLSALDEQRRHERIHRSRYLRHRTDADGAFRLDARLTPDHGALVLAALAPLRDEAFEQARHDERREPSEAYLADALVALATRSTGRPSDAAGSPDDEVTGDAVPPTPVARRRPRAEIKIVVSARALKRGWADGDEVCEIPGVGPIPVATAREHLDDAVLWALVHDGTDIQAVAPLSRYVSPAQQAALELRDPECTITGCHRRSGLENHHLVAFAGGGPTSLANLARCCDDHHDDITYRGAELARRDGQWQWQAPATAGQPVPPARQAPVGEHLPP